MKALFPEDEPERWRHCGDLRGCLKSLFEIGYVRLHVMGVAAQRVYDTDLSDDAWTLIEPMLPVPRFGGRPRTTFVLY
jgi:hypothetical protein